jgi:hypothetical protein
MSPANRVDHDRPFLAQACNALRQAALAMLAVLVTACGADGLVAVNGGGPSPGAGACDSGCGSAMITFTDAAGDFLDYTVDVTSLRLKKANGTVVQTLPVTSRIDFTQLVDLNEVLSIGQIPSGDYVSATVNVDFTHATIVVDDGTGTGVDVTPVDASGAPLTQVALDVQLDNRNRLVVSPGHIAHLSFDMNLAASNTVDMTAHTVTVSPFVVASVVPPDSRATRVRGRLASVDASGGSYTVDLRPFHERTHSLGQVVVHTTSTTSFEIDGAIFAGAAGLTQLATLSNQPMTIAFGALDTADHSFTARRVLAGTSVEDQRRDILSGNVLSRTGNTLLVGGARLDMGDDDEAFERGQVTLMVGTNTRVTRAGQGSGSFSIADLSVGQRIQAFGDLVRDSSGHGTLDATAGLVRLDYTRLFGTVTNQASGAVTLALTSIDGRSPARFNFAGTGSSSAQDSEPASYEVTTGALDTTGLTAGMYTRLSGFVTPFGAAPPDFRAETLLDFSATRAGLGISWGVSGATAPFSAVSATGITVDLAASSLRGGIELGGRLIDLRSLTTGLALVPATQGNLAFAIAHRGSHAIDNFSAFGDFATRLSSAMTGSAVLRLVADGQFDSAGGVFSARQLLVVLSD